MLWPRYVGPPTPPFPAGGATISSSGPRPCFFSVPAARRLARDELERHVNASRQLSRQIHGKSAELARRRVARGQQRIVVVDRRTQRASGCELLPQKGTHAPPAIAIGRTSLTNASRKTFGAVMSAKCPACDTITSFL